MSIASSTRRKTNEAAFRKLRKKQAKAKGAQPAVDPKYRRFIGSLHCVVCILPDETGTCWANKQKSATQAAHTGPHALGRKASDYTCIPLCQEHHLDAPDSYHKMGERKFLAHHGLDKEKLVLAYKASYEEQGE